jgi:hypothetical protein
VIMRARHQLGGLIGCQRIPISLLCGLFGSSLCSNGALLSERVTELCDRPGLYGPLRRLGFLQGKAGPHRTHRAPSRSNRPWRESGGRQEPHRRARVVGPRLARSFIRVVPCQPCPRAFSSPSRARGRFPTIACSRASRNQSHRAALQGGPIVLLNICETSYAQRTFSAIWSHTPL